MMMRGLVCSVFSLMVMGVECVSDVGSSGGSDTGSVDDSGKTGDTENQQGAGHESTGDYTWDSSEVTFITCEGSSAVVHGAGATAVGGVITITSAGTYSVKGSLTDGQIIVNADSSSLVRLVLNGVSIRGSARAPVHVLRADKVVIMLADQTSNLIEGGTTYVQQGTTTDEPNAAIFSMTDLSISGNGSLSVTGDYGDGITSKDGLIIAGGTISVNTIDDGIRGKDYLILRNSTVDVVCGGDGLKSDNTADAALGFITVQSGLLHVTCGGDAITAETEVHMAGGNVVLSSGGGSTATISSTLSAKGIKAGVNVVIDGGTCSINSAEDAVHSDDSMTINGGTFTVSAKDDAFRAEAVLIINDGVINVTKCYEGIESKAITINGGSIQIVASDDAINGAGGVDGSGYARWPGKPMQTGNASLSIHGGHVAVYSTGDGIDVNGAIVMTGGTVIIHGPTSNNEGAIDYDSSFNISGGTLVAAGSAGMAQAPSTTSTQRSVHLKYQSARPAGTIINIQRSGSNLLTFAPTKTYRSVAFSSPALVQASGYGVYRGGSSTGTVKNGLYSGGVYTGSLSSTFSIQNVVTNVNNLP